MWTRWLSGALLGVLAAVVSVKIVRRWVLSGPPPAPLPLLPGEAPFVPGREARDLALPPFCSNGWCWESPRPQGSDLSGVWGSAPNDVWAVGGDCQAASGDVTVGGGSGTLLHWDGQRWSSVDVQSVAAICGVWGASATDVWAVGADAQGLHWDGVRWAPSRISSGPATFHEIVGRASNDVFAVGDSADGAHAFHWNGQLWAALLPNPPEPIGELVMPGPGRLLATTAVHGTLLALGPGKPDGWKARPDRDFPDSAATVLEPNPSGDRVWLASSRLVRSRHAGPWAVEWEPGQVENPYLALRRFKAGLAPAAAQIERPEKPSAIWRSSDSDLWIVGEAGLILHWDGQDLARRPAPTSQDLLAVWGSSPAQGWAVGRGGVLVQWDGKAWVRRSSALTDVELTGLGGNGKELWATGRQGTLLQLDGSRWWQLQTGSDADLTAVWESPSGRVWAVGDGVTIRWDGKSMTRQAGPKLQDVWGSGDGDVWALGLRPDDSGYGVARWKDGAWQWLDLPEASGDRLLRRISGSGARDVWVTGMIGTGEEAVSSALHWDGRAWHELLGENVGQSYDIWSFGSRDVWACGEHGVSHWDGKSWTTHGLGGAVGSAAAESHEPCRKLLGRSPNDLYALSENLAARGWRLNHWDGTNWSATPMPVPQDAVNGFFASLGKLWVAGSRGSLLEHELPGGQ